MDTWAQRLHRNWRLKDSGFQIEYLGNDGVGLFGWLAGWLAGFAG